MRRFPNILLVLAVSGIGVESLSAPIAVDSLTPRTWQKNIGGDSWNYLRLRLARHNQVVLGKYQQHGKGTSMEARGTYRILRRQARGLVADVRFRVLLSGRHIGAMVDSGEATLAIGPWTLRRGRQYRLDIEKVCKAAQPGRMVCFGDGNVTKNCDVWLMSDSADSWLRADCCKRSDCVFPSKTKPQICPAAGFRKRSCGEDPL